MSASPLLPRHGERVALRRLSVSDLDSFQSYRNDEEVGLYQGWTPMPDAEAISFLEEMCSIPLLQPGAWCQVGIADRASDSLVGDIGICVGANGKDAEMGFTLSAPSQGQGLASEATGIAIDLVFENTEVDRVESITDARNHAAIRLMHRLGMQLSHTEDAIFRGEPCREHIFCLSREARSQSHRQ